MNKQTMPFRQVHLDFHTSPYIEGVGAKFDRRQFQEALKIGHVNSINLFAKCHHGWSYHNTKVGKRHPHLNFDLLAAQIEACREIGVRTCIYLSAGLDDLAIFEHPEWALIDAGGKKGPEPLKPGFRGAMRWTSGYLDYLCAQIEEVVTIWRDDCACVWLDIVQPFRDFSEFSLREMRKQGLDPATEADQITYAMQGLELYYKRTTEAARKFRKDMPIFHNAGNITPGTLHLLRKYFSHLELESLPTGGWGYDHFPLTARYAINTGFDFLGMTGKFHTTWGEFGGFKRPAALKYECGAMLAYGAKCCIGDQLHPDGEMNLDTYRLVGEALKDVQAKEPWADEVQPVAEIGLLTADPNQGVIVGPRTVVPDEGAARMLMELHQPFVVVDRDMEWDGLKLIIMPDQVKLTPALVARAKAFLAKGGKILASYKSLLNEQQDAFALDAGVSFAGMSEFDPDYLLANEQSAGVPVRSAVVIHGGAVNATPASGTSILVRRRDPYFNRTWEHYCSHQHTPDGADSAFPGATLANGIAWFSHRIFGRYRMYGQPLYRDFVAAAIDRLMGGRLLVHTSLPTSGRVNVLEQKGRTIVHLLHATPQLRGGTGEEMAKAVEVIEDIVPVNNVQVRLRLNRPIKTVQLVPQRQAIAFDSVEGVVSFTVPQVDGHQMIELT